MMRDLVAFEGNRDLKYILCRLNEKAKEGNMKMLAASIALFTRRPLVCHETSVLVCVILLEILPVCVQAPRR